MRKFTSIVPSLLALLLISVSASTVGAQSEDSLQFEDLEGVQEAYARTFSADTPSSFDAATPRATANGWYVLSAVILQFDSEDHAAAGLEPLLSELERSLTTAGGDGQLEDVELDIAIDHVAKRAEIDASGITPERATALYAAVQDDRSIALVLGITFGSDPAPVAASTLSTIVETDASDEAAILREDGTSEGGLWARFPSLEDVQALAPDLVEVEDQEVYPVPLQSTPIVISEPTIETIGTPEG